MVKNTCWNRAEKCAKMCLVASKEKRLLRAYGETGSWRHKKNLENKVQDSRISHFFFKKRFLLFLYDDFVSLSHRMIKFARNFRNDVKAALFHDFWLILWSVLPVKLTECFSPLFLEKYVFFFTFQANLRRRRTELRLQVWRGRRVNHRSSGLHVRSE